MSVKDDLEAAEWEALPPPEGLVPGQRYATHRGVIDILGVKLECFTMDDGTRVISQDSLAAHFSRARSRE